MIWLAAVALLASGVDPQGAVGGRLVITEGSRSFTPQAVRRKLGGRSLHLELRHGLEVIPARLADNGDFIAQGPPGEYKLDYIVVGDKPEFFPPLEVRISSGRVICAGTLRLDVNDLESDLGNNVPTTQLKVDDDCAAQASTLTRQARATDQPEVEIARAAPEEARGGPELIDGLLALRVGVEGGFDHTDLRASYVFPINGSGESQSGVWLLAFSGAKVSYGSNGGTAYEGSAGLGYKPWGYLELLAGPGYRQSTSAHPSGAFGYAAARFGPSGFGLGLRGEVGVGSPATWLITLDVSPFYVLGSLL